MALLPLPRLIELKLASGMLPAELAEELDPYVREKYGELWQAAQAADRE